MIILSLFVSLGIGAGIEAAARGVMLWLAILVGVVSSLIAVVAFLAVMPNGRSLLVFLLRQFLVIDLRAARKAAGRRGRVHRQTPLLLWTDVESSIETDVVETVECVFEEFPALTGVPINREPRLSLFCFEIDTAFKRYCRPFDRQENPVAGY
jgi:hypothetical protein